MRDYTIRDRGGGFYGIQEAHTHADRGHGLRQFQRRGKLLPLSEQQILDGVFPRLRHRVQA